MTSLWLLAGIEDLRLEEKLVGLLEEEFLSGLVAEAIGLAAIDRADGAVGLDLLAQRKSHHTLAVEFAFGGGYGRKTHAECEDGSQSEELCGSRHCCLPKGKSTGEPSPAASPETGKGE